jgi:hypothetical protein
LRTESRNPSAAASDWSPFTFTSTRQDGGIVSRGGEYHLLDHLFDIADIYLETPE